MFLWLHLHGIDIFTSMVLSGHRTKAEIMLCLSLFTILGLVAIAITGAQKFWRRTCGIGLKGPIL